MKEYLGDGVYVELYGHQIKLTTEDGYKETNVIFLEPEVFNALVQWARAQKP